MLTGKIKNKDFFPGTGRIRGKNTYEMVWETEGILIWSLKLAWYPSGKVMVVVCGAKSADINEAYHSFLISCWALANEKGGVVMIVELPELSNRGKGGDDHICR